MTETYGLYVWGNYLYESETDRLPEWLDPAVLSGERVFVHQFVTMTDEEPLRVDAAGTIFAVDGGNRYVDGRDLGDPGDDWKVAYIKVATDGSREDAQRFVDELLELVEMDNTDGRMPRGGETVDHWEDPHGQWDMALVKH
ncbi:hypothetical protein M1L60_24515 [Actinoplanes sp. TRM 88003]|uniref:Uncharacterized protein n=1 Tax=Paractinoplanes aksuensis TaxID=2939490 RepID=A0ABT1DSH2_9ACTN|nr:hypothetical protein [Actinoplanes aksuensis]MCO8273765.1 hypothetical protein [Actinoplanes aksuensis]